MKGLFYILVIAGVCFISDSLQAQNTGGNNTERRSPEASRGQRTENTTSGLPDLTVRAQDMNERMTQEIGNAPWMRVIYRELDLTKEENAPLYYPTRPINGNMNLFSTIFQLISEGKLPAYRYEDGYEIFDEDHLEDLKSVLDRMRIYYEEIPGRNPGQTSYVISESDIPAAEVKTFYVKEAWYFDRNNSVFDVKILALCPLIDMMADFGEVRTATFWIQYEDLRPYITSSYIMTSSINNAKRFTIDDYFRRRMFDGEIIKTENLMNRTLRELYPQPDSLVLAQQQIESQLQSFQKSLYWAPDTTQVADTKTAKKTAAKTERPAATGSTKATKEKTVKTKAPKAEKSAAPVRSVRRR